jgi:hypothetical protein
MGQGSHSFLWAGFQVARGKITVTGIHNHVNCGVIFILWCNFYDGTELTNLAAGRTMQHGELRVGDPRFIG